MKIEVLEVIYFSFLNLRLLPMVCSIIYDLAVKGNQEGSLPATNPPRAPSERPGYLGRIISVILVGLKRKGTLGMGGKEKPRSPKVFDSL